MVGRRPQIHHAIQFFDFHVAKARLGKNAPHALRIGESKGAGRKGIGRGLFRQQGLGRRHRQHGPFIFLDRPPADKGQPSTFGRRFSNIGEGFGRIVEVVLITPKAGKDQVIFRLEGIGRSVGLLEADILCFGAGARLGQQRLGNIHPQHRAPGPHNFGDAPTGFAAAYNPLSSTRSPG